MDSVEELRLSEIVEMENFLKRVSGKEESKPEDKKTLDGILEFLDSIKRGVYFVDEAEPETANAQDAYWAGFLIGYTKIDLNLAKRAINRYLETAKAIRKGDGIDKENVKDVADFVEYVRRQKGLSVLDRSH